MNINNEIFLECRLSNDRVMRVVWGDITTETVDAIVNAANEHLMHGGGVAGAIRRRGGAVIQQESSEWIRNHGRVVTGSAAITSAGKLPAKYVIHAVGPVWGSGNEELKLESAVQSALYLTEPNQLTSISIPGISSGIFGGPKEICAKIIIQTTLKYVADNPKTSLREIRFCNIDRSTALTFKAECQKLVHQLPTSQS